MTMVEHRNFMDGIPNGPIVDEDFDELLNFLDFPLESLEDDGLGVEWDASESKFLGPIPTDALMAFPPVPQGNIGNGRVNAVANSHPPVGNGRVNAVANSHPPIKFTEVQGTGTFQTQSPVSVLESSNSSSGGKSIPVRPRSKRARPSAVNPWILMAPISSTRIASKKISDSRKGKEKKRRISLLSSAKESMNNSIQQYSFIKKCTHCEVTKTPQWREGPLGPKTLCNACGVRYRSGRLFPEYRPAASPTFVPSVHSNSHRKVVEMRKKSLYGAAEVEEPHKVIMGRKREVLPEPNVIERPPMVIMGRKREVLLEPNVIEGPPMSPAPEFVPMSSYLFDVY